MRDIYRKVSLFGAGGYEDDDGLVDEEDGYVLIQEGSDNRFTFKVFNDLDILIGKWNSVYDCLAMPLSEYNKSDSKILFKRIIAQDKAERKKQLKKHNHFQAVNTPANNVYGGGLYDYDDYADDDRPTYASSYRYVEPTKSTGFLDKLNKSDTFVIHCNDRTTTMLRQIYEGRNWDVLNDGNIDKKELHELLKSHDKIICLGHGSPGGLLNRQGGGYTIGDEEAPFLKDKKLFIIWCRASDYAMRHNLHGFITGNMPSDHWEASSVGFKVGEKYMDDNITFWSKCCADHVDQALNGDPKGAAENIVKDYLAVYGDETKWDEEEIGITKYNAERTTAV